jgi:hypothetical protein
MKLKFPERKTKTIAFHMTMTVETKRMLQDLSDRYEQPMAAVLDALIENAHLSEAS